MNPYQTTNAYRPSHRVRVNTEPPSGATYFDSSMLVCAPCQSGSVNYCRTPAGGATDEEGKFDWVLESMRGQSSVAAGVSDCCTTELDPVSGLYRTTCDPEKGCGWVAGPFLTDKMSCKFTTDGAQYPSLKTCQASLSGGAGAGGEGAWFPPCGADEVSNCYYPDVNSCMPAVFGNQRRGGMLTRPGPPPPSCMTYVCDAGTYTVDANGQRSFPMSSCRCVAR